MKSILWKNKNKRKSAYQFVYNLVEFRAKQTNTTELNLDQAQCTGGENKFLKNQNKTKQNKKQKKIGVPVRSTRPSGTLWRGRAASWRRGSPGGRWRRSAAAAWRTRAGCTRRSSAAPRCRPPWRCPGPTTTSSPPESRRRAASGRARAGSPSAAPSRSTAVVEPKKKCQSINNNKKTTYDDEK